MRDPVTSLRAGSATDVGRVRSNNQDQYLIATELFAVADGMGGHAAGEVASLTAVEALKASYHGGSEGLVTAAQQANRSIFERAQGHPEFHGMGTTLVAVALVHEDGEDRLAVINVGDSRVYLMRQGELEQLTTDHSLVQELVDDGQLTEQEATVHPQRHVLTRALGVDTEVKVDLLQVLPMKGDRLLLCSDGLVRELTDTQVAGIMRRLADPDEASRELVAAALERGGNDNVTVVIVDVVDDDDLAVTASAALRSDRTTQRPTPMPAMEASEPESLAGKRDAGTGTDVIGRIGAPIGGPVKAALPEPPKRRAMTIRVVAFLALFVVLVGGAGFAVAWYARGSYFVGLHNDQLTIYKGRPGGLLWFQPTIVDPTGVPATAVLQSRLSDLQSGKVEPSLSQAKAYVASLKDEEDRQLQQSQAPTTTVPATTVPVTTVPAGTGAGAAGVAGGSATTIVGGAVTTIPAP
jgi:PPM family protein phosphatase